MRPRIHEMDPIRAIAIAAVLIIHTTASAVVGLPTSSLSQAAVLAVNKLSGFAVPLFILLSGIVLFYSYYDRWERTSFRVFYVKRLKFVVIPYVVISLFYYEYNALLSSHHLQFNIGRFAKLLLWGEASYHLYFIVIIVQFYILFPLLMAMAKKLGRFSVLLAALGVVVQLLFYMFRYWASPLPHPASLCVTYFSFFCIGGLIGIHYKSFCGWLDRYVYWMLPCCVASGLLYVMAFELAQRGFHYRTVWYDLYFNVYPYFVLFMLVWLMRRLPGRSMIGRLLASAGAASFGIYLLHPAFLSLYARWAPAMGNMLLYLCSILCSFLFILIASWALALGLRKLKFAWFVIGK